MTPVRQRSNGISRHYPLLFSVVTFLIGYGSNGLMNYISYANKVDQVVTTLNEMRADQKERSSRAQDFRQKTNSRLTALEVKVFGQVQQASNPEPVKQNLLTQNVEPGN